MHEQDGDAEPAHHARRPMNAFLIFCKRHRRVVRDKFPNLENRCVTKILGEWWANLEIEERAGYTGLAKQYKDAFFNANPDFKWYKLPAPPLRTLSSRPRESIEKSNESPTSECQESELEKTNNNSTKVDLNKKTVDLVLEPEPKPLSMFTPGKLADEAQMGGLSSLLATKTEQSTPNPYYSPHCYKFTTISSTLEHRSHTLEPVKGSREESIRELQNALTETTKVFEEDFDEKEQMSVTVHLPNNQFTNQDVIDKIVDKRYSEEETEIQKNCSDDEKNLRSGRSCKGKRYQEFMAVGGLLVNKRQRRDDAMPDESCSASCSWELGNLREETVVTEESKQNFVDETVQTEVKPDANDSHHQDNNRNKTFKAADFGLDAKINALPSLSFERFQQKKRDKKQKKEPINLKPKALEKPKIVNSVPNPILEDRYEMAEHGREAVIGSQKRKPRKISITRLEINSLVSHSLDHNGGQKTSPEIKIATEAPATVVQNMDIYSPTQYANMGLMALATLAEVASNTSKIENTNDFIAKASEDNASMV